MLYTLFLIGEETLSSTSVFNFCYLYNLFHHNQIVHFVSFCCLLLGINGHLNISSA